MSKLFPTVFAIVLSASITSCGLGAPTWFSCMEKARSACDDNDFAKSDEWLGKATQEAKKYNMNPSRYWGMSPYSPTSMPGELATLAGVYAYHKHKFDKAEDLCKHAIAISPEPNYRRALADFYEEQGKYQQAEQILFELLKEAENSSNQENYANELCKSAEDLADCYMKTNKLSQAEELYTEALKWDPNSDYLTTVLGKVCLRVGHIEKAKVLFERVLADNEGARHTLDRTGRHGASEALSNLADVYSAEKNYPEAERLYKEALQLPLGFYPFPVQEEIDCRHHYALLLQQCHRESESQKMEASAASLQKALNSGPEPVDKHSMLTIYP